MMKRSKIAAHFFSLIVNLGGVFLLFRVVRAVSVEKRLRFREHGVLDSMPGRCCPGRDRVIPVAFHDHEEPAP